MEEASLTIVSFNVNCWLDGSTKPNYARIQSLFKELAPDVIVLQEVIQAKETIPMLAKSLKMEYVISEAESFMKGLLQSDVILSKWKIVDKLAVPLSLGRFAQCRSLACAEIALFVGCSEGEEAVCASVPPKENTLLMCATHLDVGDEKRRRKQIDMALSLIAEKFGPEEAKPHILLGDFNALCALDYTEEKWHQLAAFRKKEAIPSPRTHLMSYLLEEKGYRDSKSEAEAAGGPEEASPKSGLGPGKSRKEQSLVFTDCMTSWAGTRIDYVLLSPSAPSKAKVYTRVDTDASDHYPVFVQLAIGT